MPEPEIINSPEDIEQAPVKSGAATAAASNGQVVLLKGEVKIFSGRPLPLLDKKEIKAFEAETRSGAKAYAYVCSEGRIPRTHIAHKYLNASSSFLPKISASGVVDWTPEAREKYVFIYEGEAGKPLSNRSKNNVLGIKADQILNTILPNLIDAVFALHDRGFVHGNICLQNIFEEGGQKIDTVILGECLSAPEGYTQPALCFTAEKAMAHPLARGTLTYADDIYALGITVAQMIAAHDFTEGMTAEEIFLHKIELGSFNLVTNKNRFPGTIVEFLRGTLDDDAASRWTISDIKEWMDGRRVTGKQNSKMVIKSSRPVPFLKKNYFRPDILATQLYKDPALVSQMVESGELYLWLNRSLQSKSHEDRYEAAVEFVKKNSSMVSSTADRMASFVSLALAPWFPIFYKGLCLHPEKIGDILVAAIHDKKDINQFLDILSGEYVRFWEKFQLDSGIPVGEFSGKFETCRMYLLQKQAGYGLERCIYFMAPNAHCLSEKLAGYYTRSASEILIALEKIAGQKNRPSWFIDRHIIAFLFAHDRSIIEPFSADLNATEKYRQVSAVVKIFAKIQERDKLESLPNLSSWIVDHMGDLVKRYHDREERKRVKIELDKLKAKGKLPLIAGLFNNFQALQSDMKLFSVAMRQFQQLRNEYNRLHTELETNKNFGMGTGRQAATLVSAVIAAMVVLLYLVFSLSFG